jgi:Carboxypeptidase regulatory-like domain
VRPLLRRSPRWLHAGALTLAFARLAGAQSGGSTVAGVVHDSIGHHPLAGAVVQIVATDSVGRSGRTVVSDSLGRFSFGSVPAGRYLLAFFHASLDSLGLEPSPHEIVVDGGRAVRADLSTPSAARLRDAVCGPSSSPGAAVIGVVRRARDHVAVAKAEVAGEWVELTLSRDGTARRTPRVAVTTKDNGWFAICNLPRAGTIALSANHGADSTDRIELDVPSEGLIRRELFLGDSALIPLKGVVVTTKDGKPIAGARVGIIGGPETRTNEHGEWMLTGARAGTRVLDVRAISFYPEHRPVDVVTGDDTVRVALSSFKNVLDTVKVHAQSRREIDNVGFQERRRTGMGTYLTPEDVARRFPIVTSDLFRNVTGVRYDTHQSDLVFVRGIASDWCAATIYIDGLRLRDMPGEDIDTWVRPDEIAGIEIYNGTNTPPQFRTFDSCGAIVIWTRPTQRTGGRWSLWQYGLLAAGLVGAIFVAMRLQ